MSKTTKSCEVMQYMEYMDCSFDEVEKRIKGITNLKTYSLVLHDKDKLPDGQPKKPHFHAVLTFKDGKTWDSIAKAVGVEKQYVNKINTTTARAEAYLIHKNDLDKHQYDTSEVRANFDYANKMDDIRRTINIDEVIKRIENEEIKPYNIYDVVDAIAYSKFKTRIDRAFEFVQNKKRSVNRDMECMYIYGPSGCGKTTLAKYFASQKGYRAYISSGGKNPLDNYMGEECIVLDDLRGNVFPLADFLKLTDNNTDSLVGCRYYNKSISYCKLIICTSVVSLKELYAGVTSEYKEPLKQLYRRFRYIVKLDEEKMKYMMFDEVTESELLRGTMVNPIALIYNPKVAKRTVDDFARAFGISAEYIVDEDKPKENEEPMAQMGFDGEFYELKSEDTINPFEKRS